MQLSIRTYDVEDGYVLVGLGWKAAPSQKDYKIPSGRLSQPYARQYEDLAKVKDAHRLRESASRTVRFVDNDISTGLLGSRYQTSHNTVLLEVPSGYAIPELDWHRAAAEIRAGTIGKSDYQTKQGYPRFFSMSQPYRNNTVLPTEHGSHRSSTYGNGYAITQGNGSDMNAAHQMGHMDGLGMVVNQLSTLAFPSGQGMAQAGSSQTLQHPYAAHDQLAYQSYPVPIHVAMPQDAGYPMGVSAQIPTFGAPNFNRLIPYHAQAVPYTPGRAASYADRSSEVPGLENRRGSYSTTDSAPATPFFGGSTSDRGISRIAVVRSSYNTPSPEQLVGAAPKAPVVIEDDIIAVLKQSPPIPEAVPAVFTPPTHTKSLEQCLENRIQGNRNVYIRGLHPTTDDELLLKYAERFGDVEQSKAIIDTSTGACKGFGFAKFTDVVNSERCIKGFYYLGYEVGFARESFNARLKAEGDELSTNLYLSNLPKRLSETELNSIFSGYRVVSSKILRDSMGNSRGVGFARFETRDECEDIIRKYHGASIGQEGLLMQVRYADTPAQKELKRVTAERRQFRTNEYNIGAYGTADVGIHPSIYTQGQWTRRPAVSAAPPYPAQVPMIPVAFDAAKRAASGPASSVGHAYKTSATITRATASDDGSADEGVTIVESPAPTKGSTHSSPAHKKEKA